MTISCQCERCGEAFVQTKTTKRFCSESCRRRAEKRRSRAGRLQTEKKCLHCDQTKPLDQFTLIKHHHSKFCNDCTEQVRQPTAEKTCTNCGKTKILDDFPYNANAFDKRMAKCLVCANEIAKRRYAGLPNKPSKKPETEKEREYRREYQRRHNKTPEGVLRRRLTDSKPRAIALRMYRGIVDRCTNDQSYASIDLKMSREEFAEWAIPAIESFAKCYPQERPSIDRIDPDGHYEQNNIRIISVKDNSIRSRFTMTTMGIKKETPQEKKLEVAAKAMLSMCFNLDVDIKDVVKKAATLDWR